MKTQPVISPDVSYTFADYFKLIADIKDVLPYSDNSFKRRNYHCFAQRVRQGASKIFGVGLPKNYPVAG